MEFRLGNILLFVSMGFAFAQLFIVFLFRISDAPMAVLVASAMVLLGFGARFAVERLDL